MWKEQGTKAAGGDGMLEVQVPVQVQGIIASGDFRGFFVHRLLHMNEGSAGQGCWFESLFQGPMMTCGPNTTCDGGGFKSSFSKPPSRSRPPGASIFRFDDQQKNWLTAKSKI